MIKHLCVDEKYSHSADTTLWRDAWEKRKSILKRLEDVRMKIEEGEQNHNSNFYSFN